MEKVRATNNALREHGIDEEHVISVSTPSDPTIPREVKVLSRTPRDAQPSATHAPVEPTDPSQDGLVVDIGVGLSDYARDVGGEFCPLVRTEYGEGYADPAMIRRDLTWKNTAPRIDVDSVTVLGDALQTLPVLFAERSVKRLFINNINAEYSPGGESYKSLARGLLRVMAEDGRVEVQWTTETERTGGVEKSRGHITGEALEQALNDPDAQPARAVQVNSSAEPVEDYDYSVEAPRPKSNKPSKSPPSNPVPQERWIFTFGAAR